MFSVSRELVAKLLNLDKSTQEVNARKNPNTKFGISEYLKSIVLIKKWRK